MPGIITHSYIVYKALSTYSPRSALFKMVQASHEKTLTYARTEDGYKQYPVDAACRPAGSAYLGSCGPDLFYLEFGPVGTFIADLMHYNKTSLFMIWCLRQVKKKLDSVEEGKKPELLNQFAYCLGHISHIAADIITHPYVNSIVAAYPDNPAAFENANFDIMGDNSWKFHNVLEQYQDAYVLHRRFFGMEKFADHSQSFPLTNKHYWRSVNITSAVASYYLDKQNNSKWFLLRNARDFYGFSRDDLEKEDVEQGKYRFYVDANWLVDYGSYCTITMPTRAAMEACPRLVQGGIYDKKDNLQHPGLFDQYIDESIKQTHKFWAEVENYLAVPQQDYADPTLTPDKKSFPTLRRHWNLDTGMAPLANAHTESWSLPENDDVRLCIAGGLSFESVHTKPKQDVTLNWMSATKR